MASSRYRKVIQTIEWEVPIELTQDEVHEAIMDEFRETHDGGPLIAFWTFTAFAPPFPEEA